MKGYVDMSLGRIRLFIIITFLYFVSTGFVSWRLSLVSFESRQIVIG